ncbi:cysteine proteinase [Pluteus cervinus]|uniref:Cysteine proteinase n=1 Tax=Pluteus cervinus TaxID=181527 RepID=A0ACD3AZS4_9AGAR|nr:cysteine proteinase [Pluteus cervinus]
MAKTIWRFGTQAAQSSQQSQQKGANGGTGSGTIGAGSNGAASNGGTPAGSLVVPSADSKKFGFENFANNCYANSVVQALYFCSPFRDLMLQALDESVSQEVPQPLPPQNAANSPPTKTPPPTSSRWKPERKHSTAGLPGNATSSTSTGQTGGSTLAEIPTSPPSLFSALRSLFFHISTHPADKGTVSPRIFIDKLKDLNEMFRPTMHQDAHEFLNYLLNQIVEEVQEQKRQALANGNAGNGEDLTGSVTTGSSKTPPTLTTLSNSGTPPAEATLVHKLFEGVLTSETRCLTCETVSSRDESFLDLSIDIEQNSSVTACLRQFSASEMLCQKNKFFCDSCCDLQEAEKRMKIKKLPNVLALHLKRFKYQEDVQRYIKLAYRVAFPFELRLFNTVDDIENADRLYHLFGIVVHIGNGPHQGHYVSIIKTMATWFVFDDTTVSPIAESDIHKYFGESNSGSAYQYPFPTPGIAFRGRRLLGSK